MSLRLTSRQMTAHLDDDTAFAQWYVEQFMKAQLPQFYWAVSPEGREEMVVNGRRYARSFGILDAPSAMHFVTLMWVIAPNFFVQPGFAEIAANTALSGPEKIDAFYAVPDKAAAHAIENPDERYWYPATVGLEERLT